MSELGQEARAFYRTVSRFDKGLFAVLAGAIAAALAMRGSSLASLAWVAAYAAGFVLAVKLTRRALRLALWRLRHRLLITYAFIALVPGVLFVLLISIVYYALIGQLAIYVVTSELERRSAQVIAIAEWLAEQDPQRRSGALAESYAVIEQRLPGLEVLVDGPAVWRYPAYSTMEAPSTQWGDSGGLLVKDGTPYVWAHIVRQEARATAMLPVSARFLTSLAPNLGQFSFGRMDESNPPMRPIRLHRPAQNIEDASPRNRVPDPASRFDVRVEWLTLMPAYIWENPGAIENVGLSVATRPSAVLGTVFAQRVELAHGAIIAALYFFTGLFLLAEIASLVIGGSLTRSITGAVHNLYEGTERVREGDFSHRIAVTGSDQLAALGQSFNTMTANLERLLAVAKENERLQADLEIAREVQNQLFPKALPELKTIRLEAACAPARMVSGDYYDYAVLEEDSRLALAIGDVAGKGISAALLMATIQAALRTQLRHPPVTPSGLVSHLNQFLYAHTAPEKYATFFLCVYDEREGTLTYTNAGHLPPVLLRNGVATTLDVNGIVVGAFPFAHYSESRVKLEKGDLLLFYTDGATEPENAYGEQFGEQRLIEILKREQDRTTGEILASLTAGVRDWTGEGELQDDLTLLLARRT